MKLKYIAVCFLFGFLLAACASRQAGILTGKAQEELGVYVHNANAKVKQAEDARLELELRLLEVDIANILKSGAANSDDVARQIILKIKEKIDARDERLQVWGQTSKNLANIKILMDAVREYNGRGITADDAIALLDKLNTDLPVILAPKPKPAAPSSHAVPEVGTIIPVNP